MVGGGAGCVDRDPEVGFDVLIRSSSNTKDQASISAKLKPVPSKQHQASKWAKLQCHEYGLPDSGGRHPDRSPSSLQAPVGGSRVQTAQKWPVGGARTGRRWAENGLRRPRTAPNFPVANAHPVECARCHERQMRKWNAQAKFRAERRSYGPRRWPSIGLRTAQFVVARENGCKLRPTFGAALQCWDGTRVDCAWGPK